METLNTFNEIYWNSMLWNVQNMWPSGESFGFTSYWHLNLMVFCGIKSMVHIKEGVVQGAPPCNDTLLFRSSSNWSETITSFEGWILQVAEWLPTGLLLWLLRNCLHFYPHPGMIWWAVPYWDIPGIPPQSIEEIPCQLRVNRGVIHKLFTRVGFLYK